MLVPIRERVGHHALQIVEVRDDSVMPPSKAAPAPSPEQLSMEKRLQKLMDLRQKNLITGEEYQKAKEKVLKKMTE